MQLTASADVDITMDIEVNFPSTTIDAYYPSSQSFPPVGSANPPEDPCECKYDFRPSLLFHGRWADAAFDISFGPSDLANGSVILHLIPKVLFLD